MLANRANDRDDRAMRDVKLTRGIMKNANGSCLVEFGDTRVLCTATIEDRAPGWRKGSGKGWLTAEYAMLPAAGNKRTRRETNGRNGRSMEIERLIGRSLRNVCDLNAMGGEVTMTIDCDVLQADGGTRTAAITARGSRPMMRSRCGRPQVALRRTPCLARLPPSALVWLKAALCSTSITKKIRTPKST